MRKVMGDQRLTHFNSDEKVSCTLCLYELKNLSWVYRKRLSEQSLYYIWKFCTDSNRDFSATMMIFCKTPVSVLWFAYYNIKHMNWIADALSLSSYPIVKCSCLRNNYMAKLKEVWEFLSLERHVNLQRCMKNPVKHLRQSFLQK